MIELRLWGDPFAASPDARALRALLDEAEKAGFACGLCLSALRLHGVRSSGEATVTLEDGSGGQLHVATDLDAPTRQRVLAAVARPVVATAPLVVFGAADDLIQAGLEFPQACQVLVGDAVPAATLRQLQALPGPAAAPTLIDADVLAGVANLPAPSDFATVGVFADDDTDAGVDLALAALASLQARRPVRVRVALPAHRAADVRADAARAGATIELVVAPRVPEFLASVGVVLMPARRDLDRTLATVALASGRAVVMSRYGATAELARDGACYPVGGRWRGDLFEPDLGHLRAQLERAVADPRRSAAMAERGRAHALANLRGPRPQAPERPAVAANARPSVVLEAPLFEVSSSSLLTIATARALLRRNQVDLFMVPNGAQHTPLSRLRAQAPDVLARCVRQPPAEVDLWLSTGWPPRAQRPQGARTFAVRVDWEYGALPVALAPLVVEEADVVVVHSHAVETTIASSGRPRRSIALVPHGVDASVFRPEAEPSAEVIGFKRDRAAILFTGGLIWRKGVDVLLNALLQMPATLRQQICLVVKPLGGRTSYRGFELGELVHRFEKSGAVDTLVIDRDLSDVEMAGLYAACDVYAHPYRGEGFGLPVLEALACGLPAVITAGGSTDDFAWGGGCLRVAAIPRDVELPEPCLSQPWVLEPDVGSLGAALARAVRERTELRRAARAAARAVAARSPWDAAAARLEALATQARIEAGGLLVG